MYRTLVLVLAIALLVGCNSGSTPPSAAKPGNAASAPAAAPVVASASSGEVQKKLQEVAGSGATNCGDVKTLSGAELSTASDCAMQASKGKKAFLVAYEMPGMTVGVAGNGEGKLFTVQSEEVNGKPAPPKALACPAELRVAQSGRVTCFPVGSMGVTPGSGNPHAGQGGIPMPPAGTPNPHKATAAPQKSH